MPKYNSKTQSQNGGRRRKQTKRKLRRGRKSRKVMRGGGDYMDKFPNQFKEILEGRNPWNPYENTAFGKAEKMPENKTELMSYLETPSKQREINNWKRSFDIWSQGTLNDSLDKIKAKINEIDP